jgi:hypothetical protein
MGFYRAYSGALRKGFFLALVFPGGDNYPHGLAHNIIALIIINIR